MELFLIQIFVLLKFSEIPGPHLFKILRTLLGKTNYVYEEYAMLPCSKLN